MDAINYEKLRVKGYNFETVLTFEIKNSINNHAELNLTGILKNNDEIQSIFQTTNSKTIEISYIREKEERLFCGVVTNIEVNVESNVYFVTVEAKSMTYLLDTEVRSRSFQNISMTTYDIVKSIMSNYHKSRFNINIPNEPIGELLIQYEETDWEFLRRIASKYNQGLFSNMNDIGISFDMGLFERTKTIEFTNEFYEVYKDVDEYEYMIKNQIADAIEMDYLTYKIQNYQALSLGENIRINNQKLYIQKCTYKFSKDMLVNEYELRRGNGLRQKKLFNSKIIGSSIKGKIIGVQGELVKAHLNIDHNQDISSAYWFKFSTMSASSDGSGWYCMPEIGDNIRVYFPTKDEDQCFAISAVSTYSEAAEGEEDMMGNPDNKYLKTKYDKQVQLTPEGLFISCDSGQADAKMTADGNVSIISKNNIDITAEESIKFEAKKDFSITSQKSINLVCEKNGGLQFDEQGNVNELGTQVKNN